MNQKSFHGEQMLASSVRVLAHSNIALAKYWGKSSHAPFVEEISENKSIPAVPSLSITLDGLRTETRAFFSGSFGDRLVLNGKVVLGEGEKKFKKVLTLIRHVAKREWANDETNARLRLLSKGVEVESKNDFPTSSGLASSASGFAALSLAVSTLFQLTEDRNKLADIASQGSLSSARSMFSGYVEMIPTEIGIETKQVAPVDHVPLRVIVAVTSEKSKLISSSMGMKQTSEKSVYYPSWIEQAPKLFYEIKAALLARDLNKLGELTETSAWLMHASAMAAGVVYLRDASLLVVEATRELRSKGILAYPTMDAGPHVKILTSKNEMEKVHTLVKEIPGVIRTLCSSAGEGAKVLSAEVCGPL